jgi:hypothetical protein
VASLTDEDLELTIIPVSYRMSSLALWEPICSAAQDAGVTPVGPPLLLLPVEYEWSEPETGPRELAELMYIGMKVWHCQPVAYWGWDVMRELTLRVVKQVADGGFSTPGYASMRSGEDLRGRGRRGGVLRDGCCCELL